MSNIIGVVIWTVIELTIASVMYPLLVDIVANVTGSGFVGTAILAILTTIYWIIVGAVVLFTFFKGMGLERLMKNFNKFM